MGVSDGRAVRIAVEGYNAPWVVNSAGQVYEKKSNKAGSHGWTRIDCGPSAQDVAVKMVLFILLQKMNQFGKWMQQQNVLLDGVKFQVLLRKLVKRVLFL